MCKRYLLLSVICCFCLRLSCQPWFITLWVMQMHWIFFHCWTKSTLSKMLNFCSKKTSEQSKKCLQVTVYACYSIGQFFLLFFPRKGKMICKLFDQLKMGRRQTGRKAGVLCRETSLQSNRQLFAKLKWPPTLVVFLFFQLFFSLSRLLHLPKCFSLWVTSATMKETEKKSIWHFQLKIILSTLVVVDASASWKRKLKVISRKKIPE